MTAVGWTRSGILRVMAVGTPKKRDAPRAPLQKFTIYMTQLDRRRLHAAAVFAGQSIGDFVTALVDKHEREMRARGADALNRPVESNPWSQP